MRQMRALHLAVREVNAVWLHDGGDPGILRASLQRAVSLTRLHLSLSVSQAESSASIADAFAYALSLAISLRSIPGLWDLSLTFGTLPWWDIDQAAPQLQGIYHASHEAAVAALAALTALTALRVSDPIATVAGAAARALTRLRHLDVSTRLPRGVGPGAPRIEPLFFALSRLSSLTTLRLHAGEFSRARLLQLASAVKAMLWLEELDVAGGIIGPQSSKGGHLCFFFNRLAGGLPLALARLRSLRLAEDREVHTIRAADPPALTAPEAHAAVGRVLRGTPGLTALDLATLRLPPSAAAALAPALVGLVALERLRLGPRCDVDGALVPLICALPPEHRLPSVAESVAGEPAGGVSLSRLHARALAEHLLVAPLHARLLSAFVPADAAARDEIVSRLPRLAPFLADPSQG
jgi:hypothetical protein